MAPGSGTAGGAHLAATNAQSSHIGAGANGHAARA
jgi:hypothetical protein